MVNRDAVHLKASRVGGLKQPMRYELSHNRFWVIYRPDGFHRRQVKRGRPGGKCPEKRETVPREFIQYICALHQKRAYRRNILSFDSILGGWFRRQLGSFANLPYQISDAPAELGFTLEQPSGLAVMQLNEWRKQLAE